MGTGSMTVSALDQGHLGVSVTRVKAEAVGRCEPGSVPGNSHQSWRRTIVLWSMV